MVRRHHKNVLPGTWTAYGSRRKIDDNWEQHRHLIAVHSSYNGEEFKKVKIAGGMDAGMAGIFDDKFYKVDYSKDYFQVGRVEYDESNRVWNRERDAQMYKDLAEKHKNDELGPVYAQMAKPLNKLKHSAIQNTNLYRPEIGMKFVAINRYPTTELE
jgi:hypothetical protein